MVHRPRPALLLVLLLAVLAGCSEEEKNPIIVQADRVTVINMTTAKWSGVEVWLNDHYRMQAEDLLPGQRLDLPIRTFIAGSAQYFDPKKQAPFGIEVTARGDDGKPVRLIWGKGRRR